MAVIVEPVLSEEKLRTLLAEGHEQTCLDYKRLCDLTQRSEIIELAKDVAAMQSEQSGGYIVIGADDRGVMVSDLTASLARHFDEATLRPKMSKYLAEPFGLRSAQHTIDGNIVVLIYIEPSEHGWCIFAADGEYEDSKHRKVVKFKVGDVFVRHGTSSERWNDSDRERLIQQIVELRKESWRTEMRQELAAIGEKGLTARRLEELPSSAITWQLDTEGFDELVTELMRRNDDIPLRQMLNKSPAEAARLVEDSPDELATLLDRLTAVGGLALQFDRHTWLDQVLSSMVTIYELGFEQTGHEPKNLQSVRLWLDIISRVYALGGLAVRMKDWDSVRKIADRRPGTGAFDYYGSWLRHTLTIAARANALEGENGAGLIARGHNVVRTVAATCPDKDANNDAILNSLCQFDAFGCLVVIGERQSIDSKNYYPSFARYYTQRTEPAFSSIVADISIRNKLFIGDDHFLADTLAEVLSRASKESFRFNGWDGLRTGPVVQFIEEHQTPQS